MANIEESRFHLVPVLQQLVVGGDAELQRVGKIVRLAVAIAVQVHAYEHVFALHQRIGKVFELRLQVVVGHDLGFDLRINLRWPWSQDVGCKLVQHGRVLSRFLSASLKELVSPRN